MNASIPTATTANFTEHDIPRQLAELLQNQRDAFAQEAVVSLATRIDRLDRCLALLVDNQQQLCAAVDHDFGGRPAVVTQMSDLLTSINTLKFTKKHLRSWMRAEKRGAPFPMNLFGARARIYYQPKGVVGIMSPWNVPINVLFSPLADALGAGNRVMVKPSEFTPQTSQLLSELFSRYFDPTEISLVTGPAEVSAAFSALPLDHLIFTGSGQIGKHVLAAAAPNLTPVTLELGGKSPLIISRSVDIADASDKIIAGKIINSGQLCISPDYCFVPDDLLEQFIASAQQSYANFFSHCQDNSDYVAIINQRNFERLQGYLDEAEGDGARIINLDPANEDWRSSDRRKIPLQLVINPHSASQVMQNEIFGPILCVYSYTDLDECIHAINSRPRPLALYYFGKDKNEQKKLIERTTSGGIAINDIGVHYASDDLPFGGIGASGMGQIHGREGFKTFSHAKAVFSQGLLNLPKLFHTLPPFGDKVEKMMKKIITK